MIATLLTIASWALIVAGSFFVIVSAVGLYFRIGNAMASEHQE